MIRRVIKAILVLGALYLCVVGLFLIRLVGAVGTSLGHSRGPGYYGIKMTVTLLQAGPYVLLLFFALFLLAKARRKRTTRRRADSGVSTDGDLVTDYSPAGD